METYVRTYDRPHTYVHSMYVATGTIQLTKVGLTRAHPVSIQYSIMMCMHTRATAPCSTQHIVLKTD